MTLGRLFDELKRRNVFRVAVAYLVSGWLVLQVVDVVIGNIGAPRWVFSVFLLAGVVFFLPVLFFSWAYELTPEGLKRESEVDRSQSVTSHTGRKLDLITIVMLIAVVGFVILERVMFPAATTAPVMVEAGDIGTEVTATTIDDKSIAVLAFDDLSSFDFFKGARRTFKTKLATCLGVQAGIMRHTNEVQQEHAEGFFVEHNFIAMLCEHLSL